jgi:hypothetical protein
MIIKRASLLFFLGMTLFYYSLSPGSIVGMGYTGEEMRASREIISNAQDWVQGRSGRVVVDWPRHGLLGVVFHLPWMLMAAPPWDDRLLALEPVFMTSALVLLVFVWCSKLTQSQLRGYALAIVAGLGTLLWPYAYIGLETLQSLSLLLAAYLALRQTPITWLSTLWFALASAIAVSAKLNGLALAPAVGYLIWRRFLAYETKDLQRLPRAWAHVTMTLAIIVSIFFINAHIRSIFWAPLGGARARLLPWLVHDPIAPLLNFLGLLASPNKGLILYAPVTLLGLLALPRVLRENRPIAIFAILTLLGLAGSLSFLRSWSDETWGPRYLHSTIGPLILCVAVIWGARPTPAHLRTSIAAAAVLGFCIYLIGISFYYGRLPQTARLARQNTIEAFQGDPVWNHIRFNARLFRVWLGLSSSTVWSPAHTWWVRPPEAPAPWPLIDLRDVAIPQPQVMRNWKLSRNGIDSWTRCVYPIAFGLGLLLIIWVPFDRKNSTPRHTTALR